RRVDRRGRPLRRPARQRLDCQARPGPARRRLRRRAAWQAIAGSRVTPARKGSRDCRPSADRDSSDKEAKVHSGSPRESWALEQAKPSWPPCRSGGRRPRWTSGSTRLSANTSGTRSHSAEFRVKRSARRGVADASSKLATLHPELAPFHSELATRDSSL